MAVPRSSAADGGRAAKGSGKPAGTASSSDAASPRKRTKSPGVRVIGGRIYDSEKGKTCHQCRQKTMDFAAPCKQIRRDKPCPIMFCHKCLLNRYGEKAEEVAVLENWSCPKCRGVCNCSFCMKKNGQQPTGILIHAAKATGFSSVHELLDNNGSEVLNAANGLRSLSAGSPIASKKGSVAHKRSRGKEKCHDEQMDAERCVGVDDKKCESFAKKDKKRMRKKLKSASDSGGGDAIGLCGGNAKPMNVNVQAKEVKKGSAKSSKMEMQPKPVPKNCSNGEHREMQHLPRLTKQSNQARALVVVQNKKVNAKPPLKKQNFGKLVAKIPLKYDNVATVVSQGTPLVQVAGSDWAAEDVGAALQFLEFCNAFSKVLDIKKGEPECVLRELTRGRVGRRGVYSSIVKFHTKLLSFIQKDMGDESISYSTNSCDEWLQCLVKCINESDCASKMPLDWLNKGPLVYGSLDASDRLRLLNMLCDRTLETEELRQWIDEANNKYIERIKEAKETIIAAKKKGNNLKKKLKNDVAKAMLSLREGPLSVAEHENLVSQIRAETEKAQAEMLEMMQLLPKNSDNTRRDAVRTEPIFLEGEGRVYWKLTACCNSSKMILQDIRSWDSLILEDKWFAYDEEEEKAILQHLSPYWNWRQSSHGMFLKQETEVGHGIGYDS